MEDKWWDAVDDEMGTAYEPFGNEDSGSYPTDEALDEMALDSQFEFDSAMGSIGWGSDEFYTTEPPF